jgi:hypothetical protein
MSSDKSSTDDIDNIIQNDNTTDDMIDDTTNDAIDDTNSGDNTTSSSNTKPTKTKLNISGFLNAMLRFSIYVVVIFLLSTGFRIVLNYYDQQTNIFPGTSIDKVPYSNRGSSTKLTSSSIRDDDIYFKGLHNLFNKFFKMNEWSFPYKNTYSQMKEPGIIGNIILWVTETLAFSNQMTRNIMGSIIDSMSDYKNNSVAFWLFGLLILLSLPFVPLVGLITGFVGSFMALERIWVGWRIFLLLCLPFLIPALLYVLSTLTLSSAISYFQSIYVLLMALVFFTLFPMSLPKSHTIFNDSVYNHRYGFLRALLLGAVINAFRYLNNGFGVGALVLFILTLLNIV